MAPAIVSLPQDYLELTDETGTLLGQVSHPVSPTVGPGAPTVYLDRKARWR